MLWCNNTRWHFDEFVPCVSRVVFLNLRNLLLFWFSLSRKRLCTWEGRSKEQNSSSSVIRNIIRKYPVTLNEFKYAGLDGLHLGYRPFGWIFMYSLWEILQYRRETRWLGKEQMFLSWKGRKWRGNGELLDLSRPDLPD